MSLVKGGGMGGLRDLATHTAFSSQAFVTRKEGIKRDKLHGTNGFLQNSAAATAVK